MCSTACCRRQTRCWPGSTRGAAIYVCGSLQGMASGVDAALRQIAGDAALRALSASRPLSARRLLIASPLVACKPTRSASLHGEQVKTQ